MRVPTIALVGLLTALCVLWAVPQASGRTWYVTPAGDGDASTIQAGIDASSPGDTVLVASGTYHEHLVMKQGICLRSEAGPDVTVIHGDDSGTVIVCWDLGVAFTEIKGFTIMRGSDPSGWGGGIDCYLSEVTIENNVIVECDAWRGGGICLYACDGEVVGNEIRDCWGQVWGYGGAIYGAGSSAIVMDNWIHGCAAGYEDRGEGGAIWWSAGSPYIVGNRIEGNWAGMGGGLCLKSLEGGEVSWNLISENCAGGEDMGGGGETGGGIWASSANPEFLILHNTIVDNWVGTESYTSRGGGIYVASPLRIENNIVAHNWADVDGGGIQCWDCPVILCNDVWANHSGNYGGSGCPDPTGTNGNISEDPLFCDRPGGDFTLDCASPCLNSAECDSMGAYGEGCGECYAGVASLVDGMPVPGEPVLFQNQPNPFNPVTRIPFGLHQRAHVRISVYDVNGQLVRSLVDRDLDAGYTAVRWDGRDRLGAPAAPGVYFARLETGGRILTKKMILVK